jgi:methionine-rich copper-binding protein CopC
VRPFPTRRLVLATGLLALAAAARPGAMHNRLTRSEPQADTTLAAPPEAIRLWFAEAPDPALSGIGLEGPGGIRLKLGKVQKTDDPHSIRAAIIDSAGPGTYTVRWRTSSRDGQAVSGHFKFIVLQ